jgi:hypothetical protein
VLAWIVRLSLLAPATGLLSFAAAADGAWFERHVLLPAVYPPPLPWTLPALRIAAVAMGLVLAACAVVAGRRATPEGAARVAVAILLALCASELALRIVHRVLPVPETRIEARLAAPDLRTGWAFIPRRSVDLAIPGGSRVIRYAIDAKGDRAPSEEWVEDTQAPTVLVAGESIATGHGLQWSETFAGRLGGLVHAQVVDVAEGGYGSDQAHLRAVDALARFAHPLAVVTTVLPVQLYRNVRDDRPHLVLRDGALMLAPASDAHLQLRQLLVNELPYLSDAGLEKSLALTRAILHATAAATRARGAQPLFVVPSVGPRRSLDAHPEAFVVRALLDDLPYVVVDIDPAHVPGDGHPDAEGARQIAAAIAEALVRGTSSSWSTPFDWGRFGRPAPAVESPAKPSTNASQPEVPKPDSTADRR